jgi:two-component system, OmpR family, sensor histidine kinase KdpD
MDNRPKRREGKTLTSLGRDPDELIQEIQRAQHKRSRGKLKLFFGMCPGVGKTVAMLRAAKAEKEHGKTVLIGFIETHGRKDTEELLDGMTLLPRKRVKHREIIWDDFDLDTALQERPELIVVDELPHSNAPGSKHPKRYQDIKDLLFAGIDVYTALNVQHIESRSDLVYQISGVPVRETVPDAFLELADEIVLIDLSPEELLTRLKDGKIYLGERAERAAENFFRIEKLTALRELALRFTAEMVDDQLRDHMQTKRILGPWNTNERLLVAISHSPFSARLLRATRRKAYNLEAPWVALHVDLGIPLSPSDSEVLTKNLALAAELGAEVITTRDRSVVAALKRIAGERNVTQIVMGRPDKRFFRDLLSRGNLLDQLVNETSEVDIHILRQKRKPIHRGLTLKLPHFTSGWGTYSRTVLYVGFLCGLGYPLSHLVGYRAIGFGFLLGILPIAAFSGLGPTLLGALLTALLWNFFFIAPRFTFQIGETEDAMMILAYFSVASVAGFLASRIKKQEADLLLRERRSNALYRVSRELSEAKNQLAIGIAGAKSIESIFGAEVLILTKNPDAQLSEHSLNRPERTIPQNDFAVANWTMKNERRAGWRTDTLQGAPCLCLPLRGRSQMMGVLMFYPKENRALGIDQDNLLQTITGQISNSLERESLETTARESELYRQSELLHQTLLNTVSHELRTPLTAILGGAGAIRDAFRIQNDRERLTVAEDVVASAERLERTVENLMDMSRISNGVLRLNEQIFELNDFIQSTLDKNQRVFRAHRLKVELQGESSYINGDEKLLEHVLMNLVSNSVRYSPEGSTITISSQKRQNTAEFTVKDEGPGIPENELNFIFQKFHRGANASPGGIGLGLSISQTLVEAHRGTLVATNRPDKSGACFTVTLPTITLPSNFMSEEN